MTTKVSSDMWFESEQMVKNPDRWPVWPFLPVKKPNDGGGWPTLGILLYTSTDKPSTTVFLLCLYEVSPERLKSAEKKEYGSVAEMLDDGWRVD